MRVLLGTNPRGEWELLGGRAEKQDQTPQDTIRREVHEESGLDIIVGPIVDTWYYEIQGEGRVAVTSYLARLVGEASVVLGDEHTDLAYFRDEELDGINLPQGYRDSVRNGINLARELEGE